MQGKTAVRRAAQLDAERVVGGDTDGRDDFSHALVKVAGRGNLDAIQVDFGAGHKAVLVILASIIDAQGERAARVCYGERPRDGNRLAFAAQKVFGTKDGGGAVGGWHTKPGQSNQLFKQIACCGRGILPLSEHGLEAPATS